SSGAPRGRRGGARGEHAVLSGRSRGTRRALSRLRRGRGLDHDPSRSGAVPLHPGNGGGGRAWLASHARGRAARGSDHADPRGSGAGAQHLSHGQRHGFLRFPGAHRVRDQAEALWLNASRPGSRERMFVVARNRQLSSGSAFSMRRWTFGLSFGMNRSVKKFNKLSAIAISYRPQATATPIAPVFQMLAAVAVPATVPRSLRMAPPPMNPMPVRIPYITRELPSV